MAPEHAENLRIVSCGSATGQVVPPINLSKGQWMKPEWLVKLPPWPVAQMLQEGSVMSDTFVNWFHHFAVFRALGPAFLCLSVPFWKLLKGMMWHSLAFKTIPLMNSRLSKCSETLNTAGYRSVSLLVSILRMHNYGITIWRHLMSLW
jgi:hypothetical protein